MIKLRDWYELKLIVIYNRLSNYFNERSTFWKNKREARFKRDAQMWLDENRLLVQKVQTQPIISTVLQPLGDTGITPPGYDFDSLKEGKLELAKNRKKQ